MIDIDLQNILYEIVDVLDGITKSRACRMDTQPSLPKIVNLKRMLDDLPVSNLGRGIDDDGKGGDV